MAEGIRAGAERVFADTRISEGRALWLRRRLETQILIAEDLAYIDAAHAETLESKTQEVLRTLNGLISSLPK